LRLFRRIDRDAGGVRCEEIVDRNSAFALRRRFRLWLWFHALLSSCRCSISSAAMLEIKADFCSN
jgi:hypothetical protein